MANLWDYYCVSLQTNPKELRTYILQSSFGYDTVLRATINSLVNGPSLSQTFSLLLHQQAERCFKPIVVLALHEAREVIELCPHPLSFHSNIDYRLYYEIIFILWSQTRVTIMLHKRLVHYNINSMTLISLSHIVYTTSNYLTWMLDWIPHKCVLLLLNYGITQPITCVTGSTVYLL